MLAVLLMLAGCEIPPRNIDDVSEVDAFLAREAFASACVALENRDDDGLRTYTAQQLVQHELKSVPRKCLCAALYDPIEHTVDLAVAKGVENSKRDDLGRCLAPALADADLDERQKLPGALGGIGSRDGFEALQQRLPAEPDVTVRAAIARALRPSPGARKALVAALRTDGDATVREAAADSLAGRTEPDVLAALDATLASETESPVRAAALKALVSAEAPNAQQIVCKTLLSDEDPVMRLGAAQALHGTKRKGGIDCLARRLKTSEDNPAVRDAVMDALGASPSDDAADALCELIHPVMQLYVKDTIAEETAGVDIVKRQNDRDWERSYECVQKAIARGGLSCYARNHLGRWFEELGAKNASRPLCPGMTQR